MGSRHAKLLRGLDDLLDKDNKPVFKVPAPYKEPEPGVARFGRLFPHLPPAEFGKTKMEVLTNLSALADAMVAGFDQPKDGPDPEESGIPSLYTYFGQFVDHDLTFDPDGSFQKQKDPNATEDFRTPAFDLDNVYGRGPGDQPYLYEDDGKHFILGDPVTLGKPAGGRDLQRNGTGRALIGDPRNDENSIVSQFQGLVLRFHNRMVDENPDKSFDEIQDMVRKRYQYVVLNDFLPKIVSKSVLKDLKTNGVYDPSLLKIFPPSQQPFMPVEFSVAAYRLGHSMIRPGYRLNDATLVPIFPNPLQSDVPFPEGLVGFRKLISDWGIDWARFIDIETLPYGEDPDKIDALKISTAAKNKRKIPNFRRLQLAYRIDTSIVDPLGNLPKSVTGDSPPQNVFSLALRNLLRGVQFGLPSGEEVAAHLRSLRIDAPTNPNVMVGKAVDDPEGQDKPISILKLKKIKREVFKGKTPLWTYVLAEAMEHKTRMPIPVKGKKRFIWTPQLGPVGGRIVAEVFLGLAFSGKKEEEDEAKKNEAKKKTWDPSWAPDNNPNYGLKDFVQYALGKPSPIKHMVLMKFKPTTPEATKTAIFAHLQALREDSDFGIVDMQNGPSEGPSPAGFTDGLVVTFGTLAGRKAYGESSKHKKILETITQNTVGGARGVLRFDFEIGTPA